MKYLFAIIFALICITTKAQLNHPAIIFKLHIGPKQGTTFFYVDDYSIENQLVFKNTSEKDTVISKEVAVENVTMFRYSLMYPDRNKNYFYSFYAKPGEVIDIQFDDYDLKSLNPNSHQFVSDYLQINNSPINMLIGTAAEKIERNEQALKRNRKIIDSLTTNNAINASTSEIWKAVADNFYISGLKIKNHKDTAEVNSYRRKLETFLANGSPLNNDAITAAFNHLLFLSKGNNKDIYSTVAEISKYKTSKKYKCGIAFLLMRKFPEKSSGLYKKAYAFFNENFADSVFLKRPYANAIRPENSFDKALIKIMNVNNKPETLEDLFIRNKGKLIVIDFWATWCIPCVEEIPFFEKARKKLSSKNIAFISLSLDKDAKNNDWISMSKRLNITGTQARVLEKSNKTISKYYYIESIPRYLVFNQEGVLVNDDFVRPSDGSFSEKLLEYLK